MILIYLHNCSTEGCLVFPLKEINFRVYALPYRQVQNVFTLLFIERYRCVCVYYSSANTKNQIAVVKPECTRQTQICSTDVKYTSTIKKNASYCVFARAFIKTKQFIMQNVSLTTTHNSIECRPTFFHPNHLNSQLNYKQGNLFYNQIHT